MKIIFFNFKAIFFFSLVFLQFGLYAQTDSNGIYMQEFEYQKAIQYIEKSGNQTSKSLIQKASALKALNKYNEAIKTYQKIIKTDSANIPANISLASCYEAIGDYKAAIQLYLYCLNFRPENNFLHLKLANSFYLDEDFDNAIKYYKKAISSDTTFYLAKQLGVCYNKMDNTDAAIQYLLLASKMSPADFETSFRLANIYKKNKDYDSATQLINAYLKHDSTNLKMHKLNGYISYLNKNYNVAVVSFQQCLALQDSSELTHKYLGYAHYKLKELDPARRHLKEAFAFDTSNIEMCYTLGICCQGSGHGDEAIDYYYQTLQLSQPSPEFISRVNQDLGYACTSYRRYDEGISAYLKAYELTPNDTLLIFRIANFYDNWTDNYELALLYYEKFMNTRPQNNSNIDRVDEKGAVMSYYTIAAQRMDIIKEEKFWKGELEQ